MVDCIFPQPRSHTHPFLGYTPSAGHVRNRSESIETVNPLTLNDLTLRVLTDGRRRHRIRRYLVRYLPHHLTPPTTTPQSPSSPVIVVNDDDDEDHNELTLELDTPTTSASTTTNVITTTTVTTVPLPGPAPSILPTFSDVISTSTPSTTHEHHLVGTVRPSVPLSPATIAHHHLVLRDETTSSIDDAAVDAAGSWQDSLKRQRETDARQIESRLMDSIHHHHHHGTASEAGSIDVARFSHFLESALTRTRIGYHSSSSSVSSIHAAAAAGNVANNNSSSTSYYSTSSSYNTSGSSNASSSNHSRF